MDHAKIMNSCDAKAQRVGLMHLSAPCSGVPGQL
jgi:hypothetical protein